MFGLSLSLRLLKCYNSAQRLIKCIETSNTIILLYALKETLWCSVTCDNDPICIVPRPVCVLRLLRVHCGGGLTLFNQHECMTHIATICSVYTYSLKAAALSPRQAHVNYCLQCDKGNYCCYFIDIAPCIHSI